MQQIALQRDVSKEMREYLDVEDGINSLIFGSSYQTIGMQNKNNLMRK